MTNDAQPSVPPARDAAAVLGLASAAEVGAQLALDQTLVSLAAFGSVIGLGILTWRMRRRARSSAEATPDPGPDAELAAAPEEAPEAEDPVAFELVDDMPPEGAPARAEIERIAAIVHALRADVHASLDAATRGHDDSARRASRLAPEIARLRDSIERLSERDKAAPLAARLDVLDRRLAGLARELSTIHAPLTKARDSAAELAQRAARIEARLAHVDEAMDAAARGIEGSAERIAAAIGASEARLAERLRTDRTAAIGSQAELRAALEKTRNEMVFGHRAHEESFSRLRAHLDAQHEESGSLALRQGAASQARADMHARTLEQALTDLRGALDAKLGPDSDLRATLDAHHVAALDEARRTRAEANKLAEAQAAEQADAVSEVVRTLQNDSRSNAAKLADLGSRIASSVGEARTAIDQVAATGRENAERLMEAMARRLGQAQIFHASIAREHRTALQNTADALQAELAAQRDTSRTFHETSLEHAAAIAREHREALQRTGNAIQSEVATQRDESRAFHETSLAHAAAIARDHRSALDSTEETIARALDENRVAARTLHEASLAQSRQTAREHATMLHDAAREARQRFDAQRAEIRDLHDASVASALDIAREHRAALNATTAAILHRFDEQRISAQSLHDAAFAQAREIAEQHRTVVVDSARQQSGAIEGLAHALEHRLSESAAVATSRHEASVAHAEAIAREHRATIETSMDTVRASVEAQRERSQALHEMALARADAAARVHQNAIEAIGRDVDARASTRHEENLQAHERALARAQDEASDHRRAIEELREASHETQRLLAKAQTEARSDLARAAHAASQARQAILSAEAESREAAQRMMEELRARFDAGDEGQRVRIEALRAEALRGRSDEQRRASELVAALECARAQIEETTRTSTGAASETFVTAAREMSAGLHEEIQSMADQSAAAHSLLADDAFAAQAATQQELGVLALTIEEHVVRSQQEARALEEGIRALDARVLGSDESAHRRDAEARAILESLGVDARRIAERAELHHASQARANGDLAQALGAVRVDVHDEARSIEARLDAGLSEIRTKSEDRARRDAEARKAAAELLSRAIASLRDGLHEEFDGIEAMQADADARRSADARVSAARLGAMRAQIDALRDQGVEHHAEGRESLEIVRGEIQEGFDALDAWHKHAEGARARDVETSLARLDGLDGEVREAFDALDRRLDVTDEARLRDAEKLAARFDDAGSQAEVLRGNVESLRHALADRLDAIDSQHATAEEMRARDAEAAQARWTEINGTTEAVDESVRILRGEIHREFDAVEAWHAREEEIRARDAHDVADQFDALQARAASIELRSDARHVEQQARVDEVAEAIAVLNGDIHEGFDALEAWHLHASEARSQEAGEIAARLDALRAETLDGFGMADARHEGLAAALARQSQATQDSIHGVAAMLPQLTRHLDAGVEEVKAHAVANREAIEACVDRAVAESSEDVVQALGRTDQRIDARASEMMATVARSGEEARASGLNSEQRIRARIESSSVRLHDLIASENSRIHGVLAAAAHEHEIVASQHRAALDAMARELRLQGAASAARDAQLREAIDSSSVNGEAMLAAAVMRLESALDRSERRAARQDQLTEARIAAIEPRITALADESAVREASLLGAVLRLEERVDSDIRATRTASFALRDEAARRDASIHARLDMLESLAHRQPEAPTVSTDPETLKTLLTQMDSIRAMLEARASEATTAPAVTTSPAPEFATAPAPARAPAPAPEPIHMPMPSWAPTPEAALTSTLRAGSAPAVPKLPIASRSREECAAIVASLSTAEGEVRRALEGLRTQLATGPTVSRAAAGFLRSAQSDADKLLARVEDLRRAMLALGEGLEAIDA